MDFANSWRMLYFAATALLIVGGLNYGFLILTGSSAIYKFFGLFAGPVATNVITRLIYLLICAAAFVLAFRRDTYLPFLGETVMPACAILAERIPEGATLEVKVRVPPGARVLYWAAEPAAEPLKKITDWRKAYAEFANTGVTNADIRGNAFLKVRPPQPYSVPTKGEIRPHIHYRVCQQDGIMSRIETVFLEDAGTTIVQAPAFGSASVTSAF